MTITSMTDFFKVVSELQNVDSAITAYASKALANAIAKNEKRKTSPSAIKAAKARDEFRWMVYCALTTTPQTSSEIADAVGESVPKVAAALSAMVKTGEVVKSEIKIKACKAQGISGGKKNVYSLPDGVTLGAE